MSWPLRSKLLLRYGLPEWNIVQPAGHAVLLDPCTCSDRRRTSMIPTALFCSAISAVYLPSRTSLNDLEAIRQAHACHKLSVYGDRWLVGCDRATIWHLSKSADGMSSEKNRSLADAALRV